MGGKVGEAENAAALFRAQIAAREQAGEPSPAAPADRIGGNVGRAVAEHQPRAHEQAEIPRQPGLAQFLPRHMRADHAGHAVAVGNAYPGQAKRGRLSDHIRWMRSTAKEGEIARRQQFGIGEDILAAHANSPWRYQAGSLLSRS